MSAPLAGKFQDHYEILAVDPRADSDAIAKAYQKLAEKYNPRTSPEGDQEKFDAINQAYEVLADPQSRKEFDKVKGIGETEGPPKFSGIDFFEALGRQGGLRSTILCLLYDRRRIRPFTPSLTLRHLENSLNATTEELNFVLWYLKQRGLVISDDKSAVQISVEGMDFLETHMPEPEAILPFIKASALVVPIPEAVKPQDPAPSRQIASLRRSLDAARDARL